MDGVLLYITSSLVKIETYLVITDALTYPNSRHTYSVKADFVCYHRLNEFSYSSRQTRRLHGYMGNLRRISLISRTSPKFILNSFTMPNLLGLVFKKEDVQLQFISKKSLLQENDNGSQKKKLRRI